MPGGSSSPAASDQNGQGWANIIDMLTMQPEERRNVARVLDEVDAVERLKRAGHADERRGLARCSHPSDASPSVSRVRLACVTK
jgi:hypothetical protein